MIQKVYILKELYNNQCLKHYKKNYGEVKKDGIYNNHS